MNDNSSVQSYIDSFDPKVKNYLEQIRSAVLGLAPHATELINYGIVAFALVKGGKRDQQIMMAGYKHHVGFYPHPKVMAHFWDQLDGYTKGKGSVQLTLNKPLPLDLIKEMIRFRLSLPDLNQ